MKEILEQMLTVDPSVIKDRIQGLIDILVLQEQNRIVEEIEKLDGEFERDDESNFIKGWRAALEKIKIKILIKQ